MLPDATEFQDRYNRMSTFSATPRAASLGPPGHMLGQSLSACYGQGTRQYPSIHAQYSSPGRDLGNKKIKTYHFLR